MWHGLVRRARGVAASFRCRDTPAYASVLLPDAPNSTDKGASNASAEDHHRDRGQRPQAEGQARVASKQAGQVDHKGQAPRKAGCRAQTRREGHAKRDESGKITELTPVQQAFIEHFAFQCGYCTPGFVTGATVLIDELKRKPVARADLERTISEALDKHICRCTGYVRYYEAVRDVILNTPGLIKA